MYIEFYEIIVLILSALLLGFWGLITRVHADNLACKILVYFVFKVLPLSLSFSLFYIALELIKG